MDGAGDRHFLSTGYLFNILSVVEGLRTRKNALYASESLSRRMVYSIFHGYEKVN